MAVNRMDAGKNEPDKGEKRSEAPPPSDAPKPAAGSPMQAWLPLIVSVVLMPVVAYGVTTFILLPKMQKGLGIASSAGGASAPAAEHDPAATGLKEQVPMSKLLVNVSGTMGSRFLMTSFTMVSTTPGFRAEVTKHEAQMRDTACGILSTKTIPELEKPGARNIIRSELITAFNNVLGAVMVLEIYFTDFAIQ